GEAEYCSAGHNPPLFRSSEGALHFLDSEPGLVVGYDEDFRWESRTLRLKPGDVVFLYTDGVTEAENTKREPFGEEQLRASISASRCTNLTEIVSGVRQDIARHAQQQPQSDDITLVALKYNGPIHRT